MADKRMIVMVDTDLSYPAELEAPFFQATVAAAMEYEVEVILTARAGELAIKGVAEKLPVQEGSPQSVYDFIRDAHAAGEKFKVCTPTRDRWGNDLISEIEQTVGGAYGISHAVDDDNTVTFTY